MKRVSVWFIKILDTWITWGDSFPQLQSLLIFWKAPVWRCDGTPPGDHWCVTRQPGARPSGKPNRSRRTAGWHRMCFFSITKPFWEEKLLGTKRCGQKGMRVSSYLKKKHSLTKVSFHCIGTWFQVDEFFGYIFGHPSRPNKLTPKTTPSFWCRWRLLQTSGTGLLGGGRAAGHLWIATQAPWILWWFWGHLGELFGLNLLHTQIR